MTKPTLEIRDKTIFDGILVKFLFKGFYLLLFKLGGWKTLPNQPKGAGITIAAPHTSNWDFIYALGAAIIMDVKIYFSIKDSWCRLPVIGKVIMWMGAIPIDRSEGAKGQVDLIKDFVNKHQDSRIFFLFTPEGTRGGVKQWETGFYHVALDTGLPIFLAKVDYQSKEAGVYHSVMATGDKKTDIEKIQESYKHVCGRFPEEQFPSYLGPIPSLPDAEITLMKSLFESNINASFDEIDMATEVDLQPNQHIKPLIEKGFIKRETIEQDNQSTDKYSLTLAGVGLLYHITDAS